jgi:hypothetical protein
VSHLIPYCHASATAALAIATQPTETVITYDAVQQWDGPAMWALSPNPGRIIAPEPGVYLVKGECTWASGGAETYVWLNTWTNGAGRTTYGSLVPPVSTPRQNITDVITLTTGDYMELRASHNAGANINITNRRFAMVLLGRHQSAAVY